MKMAKNLKRLIKDRGFTVADVERLSKVSRKTLYHWMGGQKPRNIDQVFSVCDVLQVSVDSLFGRAVMTETVQMASISFKDFKDELNAGTFEVILRPIAKANGNSERGQ